MADAKPHVLVTGLSFGESPRWHKDRLYVPDWATYEILAVTPDGQREVVLKLAFQGFQAICIDWLDDHLMIVDSSAGKLLRREADGSLTTYAELCHLTDQGWNEIVVDGRKNMYLNGGGFNPGAGIVALVTPDGKARQVAEGLAFPNGMAVTPDNATLIVAESWANQLTAFDIAADGSLSNRRVWASLGDGAPDGICIDAEGAVWYADVPNHCCIRLREGGEVLQKVDLDRGGFACMLGGADRKTLYIVTREWHGFEHIADSQFTGQIVTVPAPASSAGWP